MKNREVHFASNVLQVTFSKINFKIYSLCAVFRSKRKSFYKVHVTLKHIVAFVVCVTVDMPYGICLTFCSSIMMSNAYILYKYETFSN